MTRIAFAAKLFISHMLEAKVEKALNKKIAEQNATSN